MAKKREKSSDGDGNFISSFRDSIRDKFKNSNFININKEGEFSSDVTYWIPTEIPTLDIAISNAEIGGLPGGRIIEFNGLESSGKSLIAAQVLKSAQRQGAIPVFVDSEHAISKEFLRDAIGVDINNLIYVEIQVIETAFEFVKELLTSAKTDYPDKKVVIVLDSLTAMQPSEQAKSDKIELAAYGGPKARLMSDSLRNITALIGGMNATLVITNQLRQKIGVTFGDPYTTSGGMALNFYASTRIRLKAIKTLKATVNGVEREVGKRVRAQVIKNRLGPSGGLCTYDVYFKSGIDVEGSWFEGLLQYQIIKKSGGQSYILEYVDPDSAEVVELKFTKKSFAKEILENPVYKEFAFNRLCEQMIIPYSKSSSELETEEGDIEFDD